ncbi:hypothetical protein GCM10009545_01720 [Saccharopolyspora thermophila]|uniref:Uncharacterized protein n=1 Tax=Saccharopolyspora thermophila TaxID=89367 RepID=A0ABP3LNC5_9PSEU
MVSSPVWWLRSPWHTVRQLTRSCAPIPGPDSAISLRIKESSRRKASCRSFSPAPGDAAFGGPPETGRNATTGMVRVVRAW